jgi:hypothetical protein
MAFTMACPNFKKGLKMVSGPLGVKGGLDENSGGLKICALLLPWRTKVFSTSFSLLTIPWTKNFVCEATFLGPLDF